MESQQFSIMHFSQQTSSQNDAETSRIVVDEPETADQQGTTRLHREFARRIQTTNAILKLPPLPERWRQIQGLHHWEGLLQPLDLELRRNIIRYGEFNQAIYDGFDTEQHSKYAGSCRYKKEDFFERVNLHTKQLDWGYRVSRYLYATASSHILGAFLLKSHSREAWCRESNWIGYVSVATDKGKEWLGRRDIVIVWRGTLRTFEWIDDFHFQKSPLAHLLPPEEARGEYHWYNKLLKRGEPEPMIEKGWRLIYTTKDPKSPFTHDSARDQVLNEVKYLLKQYQEENVSITVVGHSLGAALAVLNAFDIAENGLNLRQEGKEAILVTAIVFGCPLVGDEAFKKRCEELEGLRILRVKNEIDLISSCPPKFLGYIEVGDELLVNSRMSPYLKDSKTIGDWHNLEAHLHLVAGTQGPHAPFELAVNRDLALVNKYSSFLLDEFLIPPCWWQEKNKGMVQTPDGFWQMPDRQPHHVPQAEPLHQL